jgi:hypothetical protein
MPQIETWSRLPAAVRAHLVERMHDRKISLEDLNQLRLWMEAKPLVPEGHGTRTSVRSSCAEKAAIRKHSCGGAGGHGAEALTEHSRLITNPAAHSTAPATASLPLVLGSQHPSL